MPPDPAQSSLAETPKHMNSIMKRLEELETENLKLREEHTELSQFSHILAHDLRAPLRNINNMVVMINQDPANDMSALSKSSLEKLQTEAQRLHRLVGDLREISKSTLGNISREHVEVGEILEAILMLHEDEIKKREVNIDRGDLPAIYANPQLLWQLLDNLMRNALRHGSQPLQIRIHGMKTGTHFDLYFENSVEEDVRTSDSLFNFSSTPQNKTQSTGIGLHICKKIANLHGGQISANIKNSFFIIHLTFEEKNHA